MKKYSSFSLSLVGNVTDKKGNDLRKLLEEDYTKPCGKQCDSSMVETTTII